MVTITLIQLKSKNSLFTKNLLINVAVFYKDRGFSGWLSSLVGPIGSSPKITKIFYSKILYPTLQCRCWVDVIGFSKQKFRTKLFEICTQNEKKKKKTKSKRPNSFRSRLFFHTSFARWVDTSYNFYKKNSVQKIYLISSTYSFSAWCPRKGHTHFCLSMYDL